MALVVYDQGYRIQTPVSALFKPKGVDQLTESRRSEALPSSEDIARDEAGELEDALENNGGRPRQPRRPPTPQQERKENTYDRSVYPLTERRKHGLMARQLMVSPVYTASLTDTLSSASEKMRDNKINHLIIVDDNDHPLGLLSDSNLERYSADSALPVSAAYQRQVIAAAMDTELSLLAATFVNYPVRAMPVIDENERVIGIVTRSDLLRLLINNARVESWA